MNSKRNLTNTKRRRKMSAILWTSLLAIAIIVLIYWELTAVLYILATLGVTAILVIVAISDLAHGEASSKLASQPDDSAAIGSGIASSYGTNKR